MSQRAAQLAEQLKLTPVCEYEAFLAAALAACARERDEQLLKAAKAALAEMEDYERHLQLQVFSTKEALRGALERAAGERASLDPQGGQHDS